MRVDDPLGRTFPCDTCGHRKIDHLYDPTRHEWGGCYYIYPMRSHPDMRWWQWRKASSVCKCSWYRRD